MKKNFEELMNEEQKKEYEEHYSPDGERIEYLTEHPEENTCIRCNGNGCPVCENIKWNIKD